MKSLLRFSVIVASFSIGFLYSTRLPNPVDGTSTTDLPASPTSLPTTVESSTTLVAEKLICLTFDACPHAGPAGYDAAITKVLVDSVVPATIFMSGRWVEQHEMDARSLGVNPLFEIGNHSYSHPHMTNTRTETVRNEFSETERILDHFGIPHKPLYRPPFGETSSVVDSVAGSFGLTTIMFDIASGDPDSTFHRARLVRSVVGSAKNGSIVVLHINGRGWHTAEALPLMIKELRARGFRFVKVSELLRKTGG